MIKHNQDGAISGVAMSLILAVILLVAALSFGGWAYTGRQDYKDNVDAKVKVAAEAARQKESAAKDIQFEEAAKQPLKTYAGPDAFGSLLVNFPKTWSGYVDDTGTGSSPLDGYFAPGVVPGINNPASVFALRVRVINQAYAQVLQNFAGQQRSGKLAISTYALPKVPNVVGIKVVGTVNELSNDATVTVVVLPLRSQTLEISTEGNQYLPDYNNNILPNLSFTP